MKNYKSFLYAVLSMLSIASLVACGGSNANNNRNSSSIPEEEEDKPLEVGDTVREWKSSSDYEQLPFDIASGTGTREIVKNFGESDSESLHYSINSGSSYLTTEVTNPYFLQDDAKNGDIISLFVFLPSDSNIASLQLEFRSVGYSTGGWGRSNYDTIQGTAVTIDESKTEKWFRLEGSYDSFYDISYIRLKYTAVNSANPVELFVDNIKITYGEDLPSAYEYNDESLYQTYEDYFIVGTCLSDNMVCNSKLRQITKDNFNSVTAENEAKPNSTLDQTACQELVKTDPTAVAITTEPFERIYDWCEASHVKVRHHTFVWHDQTPDWFFREGYQSGGALVNRTTMIVRLDNFLRETIETLDDRWPGLVYALDVVNEAIPEVDEVRSDSDWMRTIGDDYIYQAFVAASKYKTDYMDLYYNDYSFEQSRWGGPKRCKAAVENEKLLKRAIDEGILDGIGIQSHCLDYEDVDAILENCETIHNAGVKCQLTELDINCSGSSEFDNKQKDAFSKLIQGIIAGMEEERMDVNAIIVWGITDNLSWHSTNYPLMFNEDYSKKPAYYGFLEALEAYESGDTSDSGSEA